MQMDTRNAKHVGISICIHLQGIGVRDICLENEKILVIFNFLKALRVLGSTSEGNDDISSGEEVHNKLKLETDRQVAVTQICSREVVTNSESTGSTCNDVCGHALVVMRCGGKDKTHWLYTP
jgi:hypothetical protein